MNQKENQQTPVARKTGIVVKKMEGETLLYDTVRQQAHCLNPAAAVIWENCDGRKTISDLTALTFSHSDGITEWEREGMVWLALDQLNKRNLFEKRVFPHRNRMKLNRRELIKALGIAAAIVTPVVSTIVAPTATQASTCTPSGGSCSTSAECCSGLCSGVTCA